VDRPVSPASSQELEPDVNAKVTEFIRYAIARAGKADRDVAEDLGWPTSTWGRVLNNQRRLRIIEIQPLLTEITDRYGIAPTHWAELAEVGLGDHLPAGSRRTARQPTPAATEGEPEWVGDFRRQLAFIVDVLREVDDEAYRRATNAMPRSEGGAPKQDRRRRAG
jgi:hypothetical protein